MSARAIDIVPATAGAASACRAGYTATPEFFELEKELIFRQSWQIVCHLNDVPRSGDFHTFEFLGPERHRAAGRGWPDPQLLQRLPPPRRAAPRWSEGALRTTNHVSLSRLDVWPRRAPSDGAAARRLRGIEPQRHGLVPLEQEILMGFVFVRFAPGLPSVREMMAPYLPELEAYRLEELVPQGRVTLRPRAVNWKNVADNYSDGLHIPVAHPGLTRLFGNSYGIEARPWIDKMWGRLREIRSSNWSEGRYQALLPPVAHLPAERQRLWTYFKLWPNIAFDIYPDQIDFMQFCRSPRRRP